MDLTFQKFKNTNAFFSILRAVGGRWERSQWPNSLKTVGITTFLINQTKIEFIFDSLFSIEVHVQYAFKTVR